MSAQVTISASEALLWLRSHHAETVRLALGSEIMRCSSEIVAGGGWRKFQEEQPKAHAEEFARFQKMCRRLEAVKAELESRQQEEKGAR